ncbi:MAG: glycosyltransferase family 4 protein [Myxococcota bacterium]
MRIVTWSPCWPHDRFANGIATYVASIREGLEAAGEQAVVMTGDLGEDVRDEAVFGLPEEPADKPWAAALRIRLASRLSRNLGIQQTGGYRVGRAMRELDEQLSVDLLELEESFGIASPLRREFRKPVVVRLHGPHFIVGPATGVRRDREFWLRCAAEYQAIRRASAVSAPARDVLDQVRRFYRLRLPNARVIPNPAPSVAEADLWSADACEPERILFVGRFDRVKGADVLLEAFTRLVERRPAARLVFVGPDVGLIRDGRSFRVEEYLEAFVPPAARERMEFTGNLPRERVASERRRAALTVVSSRYETFSMTTLEAMAVGSPLIAPRTGGVVDLVEPERSGLLFDPEAPDELAAKMARLLEDRGAAARLGAQARRDAARRFGREAVGERARAFYADVLAGR